VEQSNSLILFNSPSKVELPRTDLNEAGPNPLNYLPCEAVADLFERSISALRLELLAEECPAFIVEETVQAMREDFDCTRQYLCVPSNAVRSAIIRFRASVWCRSGVRWLPHK
jgi:hypothetical protein